MKQIFITISIFYLLSGIIFGQVKDSTLSIEEKQEAQILAANFFNRYQQTQDITPLIKEFFVKDFSKRLKFCGTTDQCRGYARDFWGLPKLIEIKATETDFERMYCYSINNIFLLMRLQLWFNDNYNRKFNEIDYAVTIKAINKELENQLKEHSKLLKFNLFLDDSIYFDGSNENDFVKFNNLKEFHQYLTNAEKYLTALRIVESNLQKEFKTRQPTINLSVSPIDFRIDDEENDSQFFKYPIGTKMIDVWAESNSIPFKMDLIKEDGKLKIVAIYPPID